MRKSIAFEKAGEAGNGVLSAFGSKYADGLIEPRRISVLVVEDSDSDFQILTRALAMMDTFRATVRHVSSVDGLAGLADTESFDIALVDFQLGVDTGAEVIQTLGGRASDMAFILVTGMPGQEIPHIALRAGAIYCLNKNNLSAVLIETTIRSALYTHDLERRLQETISDLERANGTKADFSDRIGTDLAVPLAAILENADVLAGRTAGEPVTDEALERSEMIHIAGSHLREVLDNLVFRSAGEPGDVAPGAEAVDINLMVMKAIALIEPSARERGHEIAFEPMEKGCSLRCRPAVLTQAFVNVLSNAVKFTPKGGTIEVSVTTSGRWSEIRVRDNGIGMDEQDVGIALLPFGRIPLPAEYEQQGTGIGLPIVRDILAAHDGQLEIESVPKMGTTIILRLPIAPDLRNAAA